MKLYTFTLLCNKRRSHNIESLLCRHIFSFTRNYPVSHFFKRRGSLDPSDARWLDPCSNQRFRGRPSNIEPSGLILILHQLKYMDYIQTELLDYNELHGDGYFFRDLKYLIIADAYFWPLNYYDSKLTLNYRQSSSFLFVPLCAVSAVCLKLVRVFPSTLIPKEQGEGIHRFH